MRVFVIAIALLCAAVATDAQQRRRKVYYLAINEIIWDYAPSGLNQVTGNRLEDEKIARIYSNMYIGKRYKKAVFRAYTDSTFSEALPHDPNLGFMGPTIRAETRDVIKIHLFNNASRPFSIHPHGVFYTKANEGALYADNTTDKADDGVPPGEQYEYTWDVLDDYGPTNDDANCLTWAYHSHNHSPVDIYSGLIGALIVCKPGTYRDDETRTDVDHEFVAMFFIPFEIETWYFRDNLKTLENWEEVDITEKYFVKGNKMHVVNGYIYGNTPGYNVCQGDTISWHILGMGSNRDLHPIQFQGQTLLRNHHRSDTFIFIPATFSTLLMRADNPGRWWIACKLYSHFTEGMTALLNVDPQCRDEREEDPNLSLTGITRDFFIRAEEELWDYGPSGINRITNQSLDADGEDSAAFFERGPERIGGVYKKAIYQGYTNAFFNVSTTHPPDMGLLGPVIAAEVGDTIRITFANSARHSLNMEPHGVFFTEANPVEPGQQHVFTWTLPDSTSPEPEDPNCLTYLYTSTVDYIADSNSGLIGPLLVCKRGTLESEMQKRHKYLMLTVFDESKSLYFKENIRSFLTNYEEVNLKDDDFEESNLMHSINGRMYGNLDGMDICVDEQTVFHMMAIGTKTDLHSVKLDGVNTKINGVNTGAVDLFPHISKTVLVQGELPGTGMLFCRVNDHLAGGMMTSYTASYCNNQNINNNHAESTTVKTYYIAAEETFWDYNARRLNIDDEPVDIPGNHGYEHAHPIPGVLIGSMYKKVVYKEYTNSSFIQTLPKPEHLGILGPVIKGVVGDTIRIVFRNKASRTYNMYPWGAIDPSSYQGSVGNAAPGETVEYTWVIPDSASPTNSQPSCQSSIYISTVDKVNDVNDGLMGPLLICARGAEEPDAEFFLQFAIIDENASHLLDDNIRHFLHTDPETFDKSDGTFEESNKMKGINGYLSHVPGLVMKKGDLVRWHLIGWGSEKDYHSVHFHGNTYVHISEGSHRGDTFDLFPGFLGTVDMRAIAVGEWLLHCHVFDHMHGGMETTYTVSEPAQNETRVCRVEASKNRLFFRCNNLAISTIRDIMPHPWRIAVRFPSGVVVRLPSSAVTHLDLSGNRIAMHVARQILRQFRNLISVNFNDNIINFVPSNFIARNHKLQSLSIRNNRGFRKAKPLKLGRRRRHSKSKPRLIIDFSGNSLLQPRCLNNRLSWGQLKRCFLSERLS
uniref:hephaestin-like protein isoform X2 n=1 Tax=Ciona intestinalis TaxID=7719 RepID=UPI00052183B5|nr:hephaestin-like protein isoform X2 [Ciona intestinalis]XP_026695027.1 hephaestin-like protein isoform X1 [Ciona intestinalis]|eukprot:XP_009861868.1 hephaestin-like protein isoform X2 [Ciona intestinalis]